LKKNRRKRKIEKNRRKRKIEKKLEENSTGKLEKKKTIQDIPG
jgi:hypothetical protein